MRKITQAVVTAFLDRSSVSVGNSRTDGKTLYLFGNPIAVHAAEGLTIQTCGWKSNTTKERLNALPGVRIAQKAGQWYLNGNGWNGSPTVVDVSRHSL